MPPQLRQHLDLFCCPVCRSNLSLKSASISCRQGHNFPIKHKIPLMFISEKTPSKKITRKIKQFYEQTPFPDYDDLETPADLITKSRRGGFASLLDQQIPLNLKILEIGCGTGQLSHFLALSQRQVFATDISFNSLKLAQDFKQKHHLQRASFYQMNLFNPIFKPDSFPLIISLGVLHHTANPFKAFQSIVSLVKPGGYIIFGLYHRYGRLLTYLRRFIFKLTHNRLLFLDPRLKALTSRSKHQAWLKDQYYNPHESSHTFSQVLDWIKQSNLQFITSIPQLKAFSPILPQQLFKPHAPGKWLDRLYAGYQILTSCSHEGGLFIIIVRKPS